MNRTWRIQGRLREFCGGPKLKFIKKHVTAARHTCKARIRADIFFSQVSEGMFCLSLLLPIRGRGGQVMVFAILREKNQWVECVVGPPLGGLLNFILRNTCSSLTEGWIMRRNRRKTLCSSAFSIAIPYITELWVPGLSVELCFVKRHLDCSNFTPGISITYAGHGGKMQMIVLQAYVDAVTLSVVVFIVAWGNVCWDFLLSFQ